MPKDDELNAAMSILETGAAQLGLKLNADQLARLKRYIEDLADYNKVTNLVSKATPKILVEEHILDSLTLVPAVQAFFAGPAGAHCLAEPASATTQPEKQEHQRSLIDIGSGAGFPGLILAIALPDLFTTLVDSIEKKTRFLIREAHKLDLKNVEVWTDRVEEIAHHPQCRGSFDLATGRAVGALDMVAELTLPLLKTGGRLLLQKSLAQVDFELARGEASLSRLQARVISVDQVQNQAGKERVIIVIEKMAVTPAQYPRSWKEIKGNPLSQAR